MSKPYNPHPQAPSKRFFDRKPRDGESKPAAHSGDEASANAAPHDAPPKKNGPFGKPYNKSNKSDSGYRGGAKGSGARGGVGMNMSDRRAASPTNLIWGTHAVGEAWGNPNRKITKFWATEKALEFFQEPLAKARKNGLTRPEPEIIERKVFEQRTKLENGTVHQGLCIRCDDLPEVFLDELLGRASTADRSCIVILDQVTDPHNVGAIMRSASAFGAAGLVMQSRHAPALTGVLAKTACGAVEHMPVVYATNLSRAIADCQERGYTVFGLDERGERVMGQFPIPARSVLVLGAEGKGLRSLVRDTCDRVVKLATHAPIASLNVSNAAAVSLYEFTKTGS